MSSVATVLSQSVVQATRSLNEYRFSKNTEYKPLLSQAGMPVLVWLYLLGP